MEFEFDRAKAAGNLRKRGALVPTKGKTRITIYIDDSVLDEFRSRAEKAGSGYQTMMNEALKGYLANTEERPLTEAVLRRVIREELPKASRPAKRPGSTSSRC